MIIHNDMVSKRDASSFLDNVSEKVSREVFKLVFIHAIVLESTLWVTKTIFDSFAGEINDNGQQHSFEGHRYQ